MTKLEIRPATRDMLTRYYGRPPKQSMRAWIGFLGDEMVGAAGFVIGSPYITIFSDLKPGIRGHKKEIWRGAAFIMEQAKRYKSPIMAIADPDEPTAKRFLPRLGFVFMGTCTDGDVYQWQA
ncbi:hypothetical protein RE428_31790 [Marinobacter nanhaiticus D15-8W]|uniref:GNAT family N-acetyltransferase n=1 Tax=Marinobacter nanhaiticus D15-8W TaxID=626887 RepID=N6X0H0_9GAMM|nr:hypothetical protein [Marinobacter nanhaiticus]ENO16937.1 hypothetical protein J057_01660 [Marinobacter nanhaiticus D15-8W]BES72161.1 hypothetical protein RE428_31790 [Marinobacter nanhaiticus D15-8W]